MVTLWKFGYRGNHQAGYFGDFWSNIELHAEWFVTFQSRFGCEDLLLSRTRPTKMREAYCATFQWEPGGKKQSQNLWILLLTFTAAISTAGETRTFVYLCELGPSSHWRHGRRTVPGEACHKGGGVRTGNKTQRQSEDVNERTNTLIQALSLFSRDLYTITVSYNCSSIVVWIMVYINERSNKHNIHITNFPDLRWKDLLHMTSTCHDPTGQEIERWAL